MKEYVVCIIDVKVPMFWSGKLPFNKFTKTLTKGRHYEVLDKGKKLVAYLIKNDIGQTIWVRENEVIPLDKWRERKLKELGI